MLWRRMYIHFEKHLIGARQIELHYQEIQVYLHNENNRKSCRPPVLSIFSRKNCIEFLVFINLMKLISF